MDRSLIAYLLIALILVAAAAWLAYRLYHSQERTYRRRITREREDHAALMAEREPEEP